MKITLGNYYLNEVRALIIEYVQALGRDLSFQNLEYELAHQVEKYQWPNGRLLVALVDDQVVGCVGYYSHNQQRCEMKRLYVKPAYRKLGIGAALIQKIVQLAKQDGYQEMVLDTIKPLKGAISLYCKYGFQACLPYYDNPLDDVLYFRIDLLKKA